MQRLVDPIQYMSFRDLSGEVIHEVERKANVLYIVVRKYVQDFIPEVFGFDCIHLICCSYSLRDWNWSKRMLPRVSMM